MNFARRGAHSQDTWAEWERRNVEVLPDTGGVQLATKENRIYRDATPFLEGVTIRPGGTVTVGPEETPGTVLDFVDIATDPCGHRYLLTASGDVYRHIPGEDKLVQLGCLAEQPGEVQTIAVTEETIYIASVEPGSVQAYARISGQLRWVLDDVDDPVTLIRNRGSVFLLAAGSHSGRGSISRICTGSHIEPIVTGLHEPIDADFDDNGSLYVLEPKMGLDPSETDRYLVRRIDRRALDYPPVPAAETVWIPPEAFRYRETGEPFRPRGMAVGAPGEVHVGVDPSWDGERWLLAYRAYDAAFTYESRFREGCVALTSSGRGDDRQLLVIDGTSRVFSVDASIEHRSDPSMAAYQGVLRTQFDAAADDTQWHRLSLDIDDRVETEVRVHYRATNTGSSDLPQGPPGSGSLRRIDGIGPRKAWRLRRAGISDLEDLAERDAPTIATIVSVEEVRVATDTIIEWQETAETLLGDGVNDDRLTAVTGIGPARSSRLERAGVTTLSAFAALDPGVVSGILTRGLRTVSETRAKRWIEEATKLVGDSPDGPTPGTGDEWTTVTTTNPADVLLDSASGRYLWVQLDLVGSAASSPIVRSIDASYPRQSYLDDLPAIYREDQQTRAFLESYLALFERVLTDVEAGISDITSYLDPTGIPAEPGHLEWLGGFLATEMDEGWPTAAKRAFIRNAPELYRRRGTRRGLEAMIELYLESVGVSTRDWTQATLAERHHLHELVNRDVLTAAERDAAMDRHEEIAVEDERSIRVIEHHELRCASDENRELYSRLISCPEGFLVLCHPSVTEEQFRAIGRIVRHQRPAHTSGRAVALRQRILLPGEDGSSGFHSYLGINSVLRSRELQLDDSTLGNESRLGSRERFGSVGIRARLDEDSRLT